MEKGRPPIKLKCHLRDTTLSLNASPYTFRTGHYEGRTAIVLYRYGARKPSRRSITVHPDLGPKTSTVRILVDTVAATSGGGFSRTRELARDFPTLRPTHRFCFVAQQPVADVIRSFAPTVRIVGPGRALGRVPFRLAWEHGFLPAVEGRRFKPDVVFSPFSVAPTVWPGDDPRLAVIVSNLAPYAPAVRALYGGKEWLRLEALRRLTDLTLARAHRVFLLSEQAHTLIDQRLLRGKSELLPMAPPKAPPPGASPSGWQPQKPFFAVVGDLFRYKGFELVIEALARMRPSQRPTVLIVGGAVEPTYARFLRQRVLDLRLTEWVVFTGTLPHGEVLQLMQASIACVVPSRFENPGRPPVEAMGIGVPLIASDIPAFRDVCGGAPLYFQLDDPRELADHMLLLLADDRVRRSVGAAGTGQMKGLSFSSASERIIDSLDRLLSRG